MNRAKWKRWLQNAGHVASAQFLVQFINALTGILIVRSMGKSEYAWFTIVNTVAAAVTSVGDSGITSGMLSLGGKVWQDKERFSVLMATGLRLRLAIFGIAGMAAVPWAGWMLLQNGAPWVMTVMLIVVSLAGCLPGAETILLGIIVRLRSEFRFQQKLDVAGASLRLVLTAAALTVWKATLPLVATVTATQWMQLLFLRRYAKERIDFRAAPSSEDRTAILKVVRSLWFPTLFACFQAQIGTLVLSVFATSTSVADLGALNRYSVVFSVVMSVVYHLVAPAFARGTSAPAVQRMFLHSLGGIVIFCVAITTFAYLFPRPLLWLVGPAYTGLGWELTLLFVYQSLGVLVMHAWALASARTWISLSWLIPPLTVVLQAALVSVIHLQTVQGALWFMICSQFPPLLVVGCMIVRGFKSWPDQSDQER